MVGIVEMDTDDTIFTTEGGGPFEALGYRRCAFPFPLHRTVILEATT
jgi:hypothetical protein